jgi:hypothetical protein
MPLPDQHNHIFDPQPAPLPWRIAGTIFWHDGALTAARLACFRYRQLHAQLRRATVGTGGN